MTCDRVQPRLLDHLYGVLEDEEEATLLRHLERCEGCRAALARAEEQKSLFAEAARLPAGDLRLVPPGPPPSFLSFVARKRFWIPAAALLLAAVLPSAHGALARRAALRAHPVLSLDVPWKVPAGAPAEILLRCATVDGDPLAVRMKSEIVGEGGRVLLDEEASTDGEGNLRVVLPADALRPGEGAVFRVKALRGDRVVASGTSRMLDFRPLLGRISPDKPIYRPGESVRFRVLALERFRLVPAALDAVEVRLLDPLGREVARTSLGTREGVASGEFRLAEGAPGGDYALLLSDPAGLLPATERRLEVRAYRVPRLRADIVLDRDSYGPGGSGRAFVSLARAEGGVPAGAAVEAVLTVDGVEASRSSAGADARGGFAVPFTLPATIGAGRGLLTLTVRDGGAVETVAKGVPVATGFLDVEWFPEGGDLVAGLPNRLYFRARTAAGEAADLEADLLDGRGAKVAEARVETLGMGCFDFVPAAGEAYALSVRSPAGIAARGPLPPVRAGGVVLRAASPETAAGEPVRLDLASTAAGEFRVEAHGRGALLGQAAVRLEAGAARRVEIPVDGDYGGVVRVTVLDGTGAPLAERLVARAPSRRLDLVVAADAARVSPRGKVRVVVEARDEAGAPVRTVIGASVVDRSVLALGEDRKAPSLPLQFLLATEVDALEDAALLAGGEGSARAVDLLLGVQGWRRFAWRDRGAFLAAHPGEAARILGLPEGGGVMHADNGAAARRMVEREESSLRRSYRDSFRMIGLIGLVVLVGFLVGRWMPRGDGWAVRLATVLMIVGAGVGVVAGVVAVMIPNAGRGAGRDLYVIDGPALPPGAAARGGEYIPEEARINIENERDGSGWLGPWEEEEPVLDEPPEAAPVLAAVGYVGEERNFRRPVRPALTPVRIHAPSPAGPAGVRSDFEEVLYWNPMLATGADGRAVFEFTTSDSMTTFSVRAEGAGGGGGLGAAEASVENRLPFFAEPRMPLALSAGDRVLLPVTVANDGPEDLDVALTVADAGPLLSVSSAPVPPLRVPAGGRSRALLPMEAGEGRGTAVLSLEARGPGGLSDLLRRTVAVEPRGYPVALDRSGVIEGSASAVVDLPADLDRSTLSGSLRVYPDPVSTIVDGLEALLRMPSGCFEQASSSNYPNVLVMALLDGEGTGDGDGGGAVSADVVRRARSYLDEGYRRLTSFECEKRGYEWFGKDPGHEALTAYGLLEFTDMARVHPVDGAMLARTRGWLLDRRDGEGGFRARGGHLDTFGGAPQEVLDAYVVWALTEAGEGADLAKELSVLEERARGSGDPYVVALAARALSNAGRPGAGALLEKLAGMQGADGSLAGTTTSITSSRGTDLLVETTSLGVLAFLEDRAFLARAEAGVRFLAGRRRGGGAFGSTQATVLALKALSEHARKAGRAAADHDLAVFVNGEEVTRLRVDAGTPGPFEMGAPVLGALRPGSNRIEVRDGAKEPLPFALHLSFNARTPTADPACAVEVEASLSRSEVAEGETVELRAVVRNRTAKGIPMVLARIGIPAGLEPRTEQLRALRESGAVDFWEVRPREVTLYFRGMAPGEEKSLRVDLLAAIPGTYEGPATSAGLYYDTDHLSWAPPLAIRIE